MKRAPSLLALFLTFATLLAAAPSPTTQPADAAKQKEIASLIQQLGSVQPAVRDAAAARITAMGVDAYRIIHTMHSDDPEIQARLADLTSKFQFWDGTESIADYARGLGIHKPHQTLKLDDKTTLDLTLIPAGKFVMGSAPADPFFTPSESPHEVTLTMPFFMATSHITVDQFTAFIAASGYKTDAEKEGASPGIEIENGQSNLGLGNNVPGCSWRNPSFAQKGNHPVVQISWNDATAFCEWLSKKTGRTITLPTEAQWEFAARAGTTTAYIWGDNPDDGKGWANCADQTLLKSPHIGGPPDFFSWDDGFVTTSPVATFKPNAFGLYDMTGNVFQWCQDYYGRYEDGAVIDPTGPAQGGPRCVRGGSWNNQPQAARTCFRYMASAAHRNADYGFRIVMKLKEDD